MATGWVGAKKTALALVLTLCAPIVRAQDHLQPGRSSFSSGNFDTGYESLVVETFSDGWGPHSLVRMVTVPSFSPEWMTGVGQRDEARYIFGLETEVHLWPVHILARLQETLPNTTGAERMQQEDRIAELQENLPTG